MTLRSAFTFSLSLVFPRVQKSSSARRSVLGSIICIAISVIPLIVVVSVSDGMIFGMTERIVGLSTSHLQAVVYKRSIFSIEDREGYDDVSQDVESLENFSNKFLSVEGVKGSYAQAELDVLVASSSYRTGARIRAVNPSIFRDNKDFSSLFKVVEGSYDNFNNDSRNAILGQRICELLNLHVGDTFRIITTKKNDKDIITPKLISYKVGAIVSSGYQELDALWIFVPLKESYNFIKDKNALYSVLIQVDNPYSTNLMVIQNRCKKISLENATIYRWDEINTSQLENFSSTRILLVIIMALIVLVASVNISSSLVMLVMERRKEIAILKSIGGTSKGITLSFIMAGLIQGLVGTLIGLPVGIFCSLKINEIIIILEKIINSIIKIKYIFNIGLEGINKITLMDPAYYLTEIPITISIKEIIIIVFFILILSFIVSFIPSVKAGKENPLEIFRKA